MNNSDEHNSSDQSNNIDNRIDVSVPFDYPHDEPEPINKDERAMNLIVQLASYIIPSTNPRLTLSCLCYAAGMDVGLILGCENTETSISKVLGIPKQTFSLECKNVRTTFNLQHSTTNKHYAKRTSYQNNSKKIKL